MKTTCYYHKADMDGICSGAIVKNFIPDCEMVGVDYGDDMVPPEGTKQVFYVDISPTPEDWYEIMNNVDNLEKIVYIDHHKKAIEIADNNHINTKHCSTEKAACQLVWEYFTGMPLPQAVRLIAKYDIWDFKSQKNKILNFQYGMWSEKTVHDLESTLWKTLFNRNTSWEMSITVRGEVIRQYLELDTKIDSKLSVIFCDDQIPNIASRITFGLVLNEYPKFHVQQKAQKVFKNVEECQGLAYMEFHNTKVKISLRRKKETDHIDISEIARCFGGGGHPAAAGFTIDLDKIKTIGNVYIVTGNINDRI